MPKLILISVSSAEVELEDWCPDSKEGIYVCLDLLIGMTDAPHSSNMFYVKLANEKALAKRSSLSSKLLIIKDYDYKNLLVRLEKILEECSRETWEESCLALSESFYWEYENYNKKL